tara:strand:+ start:36 stop:533 length:498 start_codon:yes stop_codon:yes gene_type:complete
MAFKMEDFKAEDGLVNFSKGLEDKFTAQNLKEVGVSENLANALDGLSVGEFKDKFLTELQSGRDINAEMYQFADDLFGKYPKTGYEDGDVQNAMSVILDKVFEAFSDDGYRGLYYDYKNDQFTAPENGTGALPESLTPEQSSNTPGQDYNSEVYNKAQEILRPFD